MVHKKCDKDVYILLCYYNIIVLPISRDKIADIGYNCCEVYKTHVDF